MLLCGIVDALLSGVPSDDPLLKAFLFILNVLFLISMALLLNGRDVLKNDKQESTCDVWMLNSASGVNFCREYFCGNYFLQVFADHEKEKTKIRTHKKISATRYI